MVLTIPTTIPPPNWSYNQQQSKKRPMHNIDPQMATTFREFEKFKQYELLKNQQQLDANDFDQEDIIVDQSKQLKNVLKNKQQPRSGFIHNNDDDDDDNDDNTVYNPPPTKRVRFATNGQDNELDISFNERKIEELTNSITERINEKLHDKILENLYKKSASENKNEQETNKIIPNEIVVNAAMNVQRNLTPAAAASSSTVNSTSTGDKKKWKHC
ncbi:hypothetical protein BgiBS90_028894 [Biomphalaria glabrata]|nr:hypothetical protein BgiBS90_028893 [Biomphalaria glabrata]KAI8767588.1 hypothetical protein BgiBS90_028894 [Biomphalaria glabrata]